MKKPVLALALAAAALSSVPAWAHHSFAMFDRTKKVVVKGTVKEFQWTNPHVFIQLMVPNTQGVAEEWSIEGGSPNMLFRQGWDNKSFKTEDQVAVTINPLADGGRGGTFLVAEFSDGHKVVGGNGGPAQVR